eukprot:3023319-Pleurochrysis_carterae.AAC.1
MALNALAYSPGALIAAPPRRRIAIVAATLLSWLIAQHRTHGRTSYACKLSEPTNEIRITVSPIVENHTPYHNWLHDTNCAEVFLATDVAREALAQGQFDP